MYSFISMTYMHSCDIPVVEKLNLTFQKDSMNKSTVELMINSTKSAPHALLITPDSKERELAEKLYNDVTVFFYVVILTSLNTRQTFKKRVRQKFYSRNN